VLPVIDYAVNYEYVSKVLCINKGKPAMHCNGKCHLKKQLAKASENEKPISSNKKVTAQENDFLFYELLKSVNFRIGQLPLKREINGAYSNLYIAPDCNVFWHPPTQFS